MYNVQINNLIVMFQFQYDCGNKKPSMKSCSPQKGSTNIGAGIVPTHLLQRPTMINGVVKVKLKNRKRQTLITLFCEQRNYTYPSRDGVVIGRDRDAKEECPDIQKGTVMAD